MEKSIYCHMCHITGINPNSSTIVIEIPFVGKKTDLYCGTHWIVKSMPKMLH